MSHTIFVSNCDTILGDALCRELVMGNQQAHFGTVMGSAHTISRSGSSLLEGVCLVELPSDASEQDMQRHLKHVDTLVLVPNVASSHMVQQMETFVRAGKQAGVKRCLLVSILGAEDQDVELGKKFHRIEECVKNGMASHCIVRHGHLANWLFAWLGDLKTENTIKLPLKQDAQYAPMDLCDLCAFVGYMCAEHARGGRTENLYKLTGMELVTGPKLVEKMNQTLGTKIQFQHIDEQQGQRCLEQILKDKEMAKNVTGIFQLINRGKYNQISKDQQKTIGKEPIKLEQFFKNNQARFKKGQQQGMLGSMMM